MWTRKMTGMTPYHPFEELFCFAFKADILLPIFRTVVLRLCQRPRLEIANIPPPPHIPAVNPPRCIVLQGKGAWRLANIWCKSKRMWTRKMSGMTP